MIGVLQDILLYSAVWSIIVLSASAAVIAVREVCDWRRRKRRAAATRRRHLYVVDSDGGRRRA